MQKPQIYLKNKNQSIILYDKPLSKKLILSKWQITEPGFGFEVLVNFVFNNNGTPQFSIKDGNGDCDVYFSVYKNILSLKPCQTKFTKGLWVTAKRVQHLGFTNEIKQLASLIFNVLDVAKEDKTRYIGFPCILVKQGKVSANKLNKLMLKTVRNWITKNQDYNIEAVFCCPDERLYKKLNRFYKKITKQR